MSTEKNFQDLRTEYSWGALSEENVLNDPLEQFNKWYEEYAKTDALDTTAVTVSTVNEHGVPDARIVLLKEITNGKFVFYTNYQSKKGHDIFKNPNVHLLFFWPEMERQIRITGVASKMSIEQSRKYFYKRPFESRVAAVVSPQSKVVPNRNFLEEKFFTILEQKSDDDFIEMPEHWGGIMVEPTDYEFWQGRISRLHDRLKYKKVGGKWVLERLAP